VGEMADLDDEPDQVPLPVEQVQKTIVRLLAGINHSLILTHGQWANTHATIGMRSAAEA